MRKILMGLGLLVVAALAAWWWWPREALMVTVATLARGEVEQVVSNTRAGTLQACQRSKLSMPMGGRVAKLYVKEGDHVAKGEVLLEIWNADRAAALAQAQAGADAAALREQQVCVQADQSARDLDRVHSLAQQQLVSADAVDQAQTKSRAARSACDASRADVTTARAQVKMQVAQLEETKLRAPFAGIVAEINGEIGEYVTPSPPGVATPPAVDLIDDSCLYVTAPIDEVDAAQVKVGLPARISMDAFRGRNFPGKVTRIAPYVLDKEKQARTVDVDVRFDQPPADVALLAGYSADVDIVLTRHENVLRLPAEALLDGKAVLVRDRASGKLSKHDVKTGISNWTWVEVLDGVREGEQVVTSLDRTGVVEGAVTGVEP